MVFFARPVTKERLKRFARIRHEISNQTERLVRLKARLEAPAKVPMDGMPKNHTERDRLGRLVARKVDLERRIAKSIAFEACEEIEIERAIALLEAPIERQILRLKYVDDETWKGVVDTLYGAERDYIEHYEDYQRKTYYYHKRALIRVEILTAIAPR